MTTMTETATAIRVAPIPADFLLRAREQGIDDQGQPVMRMRAEGGEPCRDVLRRAKKGEELILASFSPFKKVGPYREFGPVFILADASDEDVSFDRFPAVGTDDGYFIERFVIRAYSEDEEIIDAAMVNGDQAEATIERFFSLPKAAFLHVRFPVYGCFACRIDRC